ncbi:MAG: hypothetical protein OXI60_11600, partial [Acidiferrobacterales bacterium]|nr:hypothetical protein [Acidiferrobacterales bacterium]
RLRWTAVGRQEGIEEGIEKGIEEGIEKGIEEGIEKGIEQGREEVAERMLRKGCTVDDIRSYTGLTVRQIRSLQGGD